MRGVTLAMFFLIVGLDDIVTGLWYLLLDHPPTTAPQMIAGGVWCLMVSVVSVCVAKLMQRARQGMEGENASV